MPDDAKFRVSQYQLTLLRHNVPLNSIKFGGTNLPKEVPLDSARIGDKVHIDVQQVQRENFRGAVEYIPYNKHVMIELR